MNVEKATVLIVLKRLALSRTTYKLIGILVVASGVAQGTMLMELVSALICAASGCTD
jgi:hypothetical protein